MSIAEQYRARAQKSVKLPSGFTFVIRRIPPLLIPDLTFDVPEDVKELSLEERRDLTKKLLTEMMKIFPSCVVEPRIVVGDEVPKDAIHFNDLDFDDLLSLFSAILEHSGLSGPEVQRRKKFPRKQSRKKTG